MMKAADSSKQWHLPIKLEGLTSQRAIILMFPTTTTSNHTQQYPSLANDLKVSILAPNKVNNQ